MTPTSQPSEPAGQGGAPDLVIWSTVLALFVYYLVEPFRETSRLSETERAMLMGGACAKAYGWEPKKG